MRHVNISEDAEPPHGSLKATGHVSCFLSVHLLLHGERAKAEA